MINRRVLTEAVAAARPVGCNLTLLSPSHVCLTGDHRKRSCIVPLHRVLYVSGLVVSLNLCMHSTNGLTPLYVISQLGEGGWEGSLRLE